MAHVRTPVRVTDAILAFCQSLDPSAGVPELVDVEAPSTAAPDECFMNVAAMVRRRGGRSRHGWMILEWPGVLLEAQFHAVWERVDGTLVDVTPNHDSRTMFLPDSTRVYDGTRTPSRQRALSSDPSVLRFIDACQELWSYETAHWVDDGTNAGLDLPPLSLEFLVHWYLQQCRLIAQVALYHHLGINPPSVLTA